MLNEDGVSVKGCSYIYAPRGQALEYSALAANPYRGCSHACKYCYCPTVLKMDRSAFNAGAVPRTNFLDKLERDALKYQQHGVDEQVLLSFSTDPYPVEHHLTTRRAIEILQRFGLSVCTLTKGGTRALRDIDLFRPTRDAFACTLTSLDEQFQRKWEPGAASPADRIAAMKAFHERGVFTWVSLEPVVDTAASLKIMDACHPFVDRWKIGRANYLGTITRDTDWEGYTQRMLEKVLKLGASAYFKRDLQGFLPLGYLNPLRVPQRH